MSARFRAGMAAIANAVASSRTQTGPRTLWGRVTDTGAVDLLDAPGAQSMPITANAAGKLATGDLVLVMAESNRLTVLSNATTNERLSQ